MDTLVLQEFQKGFNDSYYLQIGNKDLAKRLSPIVEKENNSYSRGFEKGLIQAKQELEQGKVKFDKSQYHMQGIKAIRDKKKSQDRSHDIDR